MDLANMDFVHLWDGIYVKKSRIVVIRKYFDKYNGIWHLGCGVDDGTASGAEYDKECKSEMVADINLADFFKRYDVE